MRRHVGWGLLVMVGMSLMFWGCLDSKTVVTVNSDGSGTIEQTAYMKIEGEGMKEKTLDEMKADCEKSAKALGEGVTVKSVTSLEPKGKWKGFKIVYAFADVTKVRIGLVPPMGDLKTSAEDQYRFEFQGGAQPKLTIVRPPMKMGDDKEDEKEPPAEMLAAFEGMKLEFDLKVNGTITNTNAESVNADKNTITLIREDIGGMVRDKEAMKAAKAMGKVKDPKDIRAALKNPVVAKYIQMEPEEKITIEFKP